MCRRLAGRKKNGRNPEVTDRNSLVRRGAQKTLHRSEAIFYRRHKSLVSHTREYARTTVVYSGAMATESNANDIADFDIDEVIDWDKHDIPSKVC